MRDSIPYLILVAIIYVVLCVETYLRFRPQMWLKRLRERLESYGLSISVADEAELKKRLQAEGLLFVAGGLMALAGVVVLGVIVYLSLRVPR